MKNNTNIQIIGTQRSGTNLLRLMLSQFKFISAPHPPHLLKTFLPVLWSYGNLNIDKNFKRLINDVINRIANNPVTWSLQFSVNELVVKCKKRTLFELFDVIYKTKMEHDSGKIWCCKSTFNVHFFKYLETENIKPFYIHLYRDGRDVALSFRKTPVGPKHNYHIANEWKDDQEAALRIRGAVGSKRYLAIKYEELISRPEMVMQKLCSKLGIQYTDHVLEFHSSKESLKTAHAGEMWENVKKPVIKGNSDKYKHEMSANDIALFENVAGGMLTILGYETQIIDQSKAVIYSENDVKGFDRQNERMMQEIKADIVNKQINLITKPAVKISA